MKTLKDLKALGNSEAKRKKSEAHEVEEDESLWETEEEESKLGNGSEEIRVRRQKLFG